MLVEEQIKKSRAKKEKDKKRTRKGQEKDKKRTEKEYQEIFWRKKNLVKAKEPKGNHNQTKSEKKSNKKINL
jgi:hypothetical protein